MWSCGYMAALNEYEACQWQIVCQSLVTLLWNFFANLPYHIFLVSISSIQDSTGPSELWKSVNHLEKISSNGRLDSEDISGVAEKCRNIYAFIWMLELAHADLTVDTSRLKFDDQCDGAFVEQLPRGSWWKGLRGIYDMESNHSMTEVACKESMYLEAWHVHAPL